MENLVGGEASGSRLLERIAAKESRCPLVDK